MFPLTLDIYITLLLTLFPFQQTIFTTTRNKHHTFRTPPLPIPPLGLSRNVYHCAASPGESFGHAPWSRHRTRQVSVNTNNFTWYSTHFYHPILNHTYLPVPLHTLHTMFFFPLQSYVGAEYRVPHLAEGLQSSAVTRSNK